MTLSSRERALLDFEASWWQGSDPKALAIGKRFMVSPSAYYRRLAALIERPDALAYDPLLVRRLRRRRNERIRTRYEGPAAHRHKR
ncbi:MAG TPA: DUF3263 domain-containing protein [Acidimicrobiales bacterium]|nr:DUF3263 domain-containing protein [Acidimicrobiales bacterium]